MRTLNPVHEVLGLILQCTYWNVLECLEHDDRMAVNNDIQPNDIYERILVNPCGKCFACTYDSIKVNVDFYMSNGHITLLINGQKLGLISGREQGLLVGMFYRIFEDFSYEGQEVKDVPLYDLEETIETRKKG